MQPKKNPKADLAKSSGLFFAIGFALVSGLSLFAFEYTHEDKGPDKVTLSDADKNLDEDQEQFVMENPDTPPPPPPPPAPAVVEEVEVVDNKTDIKDEIIASTETSKKEEVVAVQKIETPQEEEVAIDVPFAVIEDKPMFEVCKNVPKDKQMQCFKENLDKHVKNTFKYPPAALEMGIQGRVNVSFRINTDGTVSILGVRGTDKLLEEEAKRIIKSIPKLIPGKQRGKPTPVTFAYPINFTLSN